MTRKVTQLELDSPVSEIKGVGEKTAELFRQKELYTVDDLLRFYPRRYEFYEEITRSDLAAVNEMCVLRLILIGGGSVIRAGGKTITVFRTGDEGGNVRVTFFNQPYMKKSLAPSSVHIFRGILKKTSSGALFLEHPQVFSEEDYGKLRGTLQPVYSLGKGIKNSQVVRSLKNVFEELQYKEDWIGSGDREILSLMERSEAEKMIHFPDGKESLLKARERIVFDEFLFFRLAVMGEKKREIYRLNRHPLIATADPERLIEKLPYELTVSQKTAWREVREDLCGNHVMNRLLQGDVGSGKTIIAFLALLLTASNGRQGALMAPTEVLAEQHMRDLKDMAERYGLPVRPVLLTGAVKGRERREAYRAAASGEVNVIVGTHALIQDSVVYKDLALVITDEQHRFGVRQRECFAGKGEDVPILVMSATPIPRTLAIILYGDLRVSVLRDMPRNRLPVKNTVLDSGWREKSFSFIEKQLAEGHQAYIVCAAVEAAEDPRVQNVEEYAEIVRKRFPEFRISMLHGRMKPAEKDRIMNEFSEGKTDILVSTTVIEVGINVPNATVMMIENAERFGLAQLHQLRGRVGRGSAQSYCIFLYCENCPEKPHRLEILEKTNDGFEIAEQDLKLRGPGDLFGLRQSGELGFVLADIYEDSDVLKKAAGYADAISDEDPRLELDKYVLLKAALERTRAKSVDFRTI